MFCVRSVWNWYSCSVIGLCVQNQFNLNTVLELGVRRLFEALMKSENGPWRFQFSFCLLLVISSSYFYEMLGGLFSYSWGTKSVTRLQWPLPVIVNFAVLFLCSTGQFPLFLVPTSITGTLENICRGLIV